MIIVSDADTLLLIRQPDHARLAGEILTHWQAGHFATHPRRDAILAAAREHDNGWTEEDADPLVDRDGQPIDFVAIDLATKVRVWHRGVERAAAADPYAAALIAQHALTVYGERAEDPAWTYFFAGLDARRTSLLAQAAISRDIADADYPFVNLSDRLSLTFCLRRTAPWDVHGHRLRFDRGTLHVAPDPFGGASVPLRVRARRIAARPYASAADLRAALDDAEPMWVTGEARGG